MLKELHQDIMGKTPTVERLFNNSQQYLIGDIRNNVLAPVSLAPVTSLALVV